MTITPRVWDTFLLMVEAEEVTPDALAATLALSRTEVDDALERAAGRRQRRRGGNAQGTLMTPLLERPDVASGFFKGRGGFSMLDLL